MKMACAIERTPQQQQHEAQRMLSAFSREVPPCTSKTQRDDHSGDCAVLRNFGLPVAQQLQPELLEHNYLHQWIQYRSDGGETALDAFMGAKLESERFVQWAGVRRSCVRPAVTSITFC